jgi:hypothetical protein
LQLSAAIWRLLFWPLSRKIDHDLLFCPETELVLPDIQGMVAQVLRETEPNVPAGHHETWIIDIISREVLVFIIQRRPIR